jgi:hypothetical protein
MPDNDALIHFESPPHLLGIDQARMRSEPFVGPFHSTFWGRPPGLESRLIFSVYPLMRNIEPKELTILSSRGWAVNQDQEHIVGSSETDGDLSGADDTALYLCVAVKETAHRSAPSRATLFSVAASVVDDHGQRGVLLNFAR